MWVSWVRLLTNLLPNHFETFLINPTLFFLPHNFLTFSGNHLNSPAYIVYGILFTVLPATSNYQPFGKAISAPLGLTYF